MALSPNQIVIVDTSEIFLHAAALYVQHLAPESSVACVLTDTTRDWDHRGLPAPLDILLVDLGVPGRIDLSVLARLRVALPQTFLVALMLFETPFASDQARRAGADAVVLKSQIVDDLPRVLLIYQQRSEMRIGPT